MNNLLLPSRSGFARGGLTVPRFDDTDHELVDLESLGLLFPLEGGAQGTNVMADVLTQTVDGRDLNEIWREFSATLLLNNRRRNLLLSLLTFDVSAPIEDVPQLATGNFEEASEFGVPKGIRGGDYFSLGYDFKWYDVALRYTWMYLAEASAAQVESLHNMALEADNRLMFTKVLKAIFNNVNRTATIRGTAVNVYPFYNNDGTVPPDYILNTFTSTHQHYVTSGAATVDSGDLDQMETLIAEHGYGRVQGSRLILLVHRTQLATIRTFRVATGSSYDFIPAAGQPPFLLPANVSGIAGATIPTSINGLPVAGGYGNWIVMESDFIPVGYMLGFATGGEQQATNPVGIRQHTNAALRGLRQVRGPIPDYPLIDSYYQRGFGTGVRHRGAGAVMQITAAGSYTIPTLYQ